MTVMCSQNKEPYVIGGDFNLLRYSFEKINHHGPVGTLVCLTLYFICMS
jgi:hypothetical protein